MFIEIMRGLAAGIRWVHRTNLHLTLRFLGDAVDPKRLAALGKNLSGMLPRRPGSSAILHFL
jgi:2'-5' RNA ligase